MPNRASIEAAAKINGFYRLERVKSGKHRGEYKPVMIAVCTDAEIYGLIAVCEQYTSEMLLTDVKKTILRSCDLQPIIDKIIAAGYITVGDVVHKNALRRF